MKVELLVSEWCASCHQAEKVWRQVSEERDFDFAVVDMGQPEGKALVSRLRLKTIPALVIDGQLVAIGVQPPEEARKLVASAPPKRTGATRHIGLAMSLTGRVAVHASMIYLVLAGTALFQGSLFLAGYARPAALHLFTLGFLTFLIYALGEHMLPRFTGNPIRMGAVAWGQQAMAHAGLIMLGAGFWLHLPMLAATGGFLAWTGLLIFTLRLWPVLWPRKLAGRVAVVAAPIPRGGS
jgi:glutaredoxin